MVDKSCTGRLEQGRGTCLPSSKQRLVSREPSNGDLMVGVRDHVRVQIHPLPRRPSRSNSPTAAHDSLGHQGVFDAVAAHEITYGMELRNSSDKPLHVWAFYFDCSDLSIGEYLMRLILTNKFRLDAVEYYRPAAWDTRGEPPLPAGGCLTVGYGSGGGQPFNYFLRDGQTMDLGYIKFFLSTKPMDLRHVSQDSPFLNTSRGTELRPRPIKEVWDTLTVAVIQRNPVSARQGSYIQDIQSGY